jgi:arsenite methyltransferase
MPDTDVWAKWLRTGRDGGSERMRAVNLERLATVRDRILDRAEIQRGDTVLDVGTGHGLLGLAALDRVGADGEVIFSDVSEPALDDCRAEVARMSALERSRFVPASATDLSPIPPASVDVIVERAVLLFIEDPGHVFDEYHRVLRPDGRLSLGEPLNIWMAVDRPGYLWGYDVTGVTDLERKLVAIDGATGTADRDLLCGFDDRDLIDMAHDAGFHDIDVQTDLSLGPPPARNDIDVFLDTAPNPLAATTRALITAALTPAEAERFVSVLGDALRAGRGERRQAMTLLRAWA